MHIRRLVSLSIHYAFPTRTSPTPLFPVAATNFATDAPIATNPDGARTSETGPWSPQVLPQSNQTFKMAQLDAKPREKYGRDGYIC